MSSSCVKTNTAESFPGAPGLRNNSGARSRHGDSTARAEGLDLSKIFTHCQFSAQVSCSGFVFPTGLLYRPNVGRFAQGQIKEVLLVQKLCALLKSTSLLQTSKLQEHQRKYWRFSFKVKKKPYFYASLVVSLTESLKPKYSKNTPAEENSWPEKYQLKC